MSNRRNALLRIFVVFFSNFVLSYGGPGTYPFCIFDLTLRNNNKNMLPIKVYVAAVHPSNIKYANYATIVESKKDSDFHFLTDLNSGDIKKFNKDTIGDWDRSPDYEGAKESPSWTEGYSYVFRFDGVENVNNISGKYYLAMDCYSRYKPKRCSMTNKSGCASWHPRSCSGHTNIYAWTVPGDEFIRTYYNFDINKYSEITFVIKDKKEIPYLNPQEVIKEKIYSNGVSPTEICYAA